MMVAQKFLDKFVYDARRDACQNAFVAYIIQTKTKDSEPYYSLSGNAACHGRLQKGYYPKGVVAILSLVREEYAKDKKDDCLRYITWLANESPWAAIFVEKDANRIWNYGWVISPDHPANFVASGCIATRFFTENYELAVKKRFKIWVELTSNGYSGTEAFLFANLIASTHPSLYPMSAVPLTNGHTVFDAVNMSFDVAKAFLSYRPTNLQPLLNVQEGVAGGVFALWSGNNGDDKFAKLFCKLTPTNATTKVDLHIFRGAKKESALLRNIDDVKSVIEQAKVALYAKS